MITIRSMKSFLIEFYNTLQPYKVPIAIMLCFSALAFVLNTFLYQFPGNNYIRSNILPLWFFLVFSIIVFCRMYGVNIASNKTIQGYLLYFFVAELTLIGVNAIQYTPFNPIDAHILALEKTLHIHSLSLVIWTTQHPLFNYVLGASYNLLTYEMVIFPLYALTIKKYDYLYEYFHLVLIALCFGFIFYYFFPTTGPASNLPETHFKSYQLATGLKFWQIHHYQQPTTIYGGMVAMPSYHVIWAWLVVYLTRFNPVCCFALTITNMVLTLSCVLLGWHYCLDIVGSFFVLTLTFYVYKKGIVSKRMVRVC